MNTFRNKHFKNQLDPNYVFYECLCSCEIKSTSEKSLEGCIDNCELKNYQRISITKNKNLKSI